MKITRQKIFTVFIIFGVGTVLTAVFFGGNFMDHDADHPCFFSLISGINCLSADRLTMINHLFSGWRNLTAAIIDFKTIVLVPAFLIFFLFVGRRSEVIFQKGVFFSLCGLVFVNDQKEKFFHWLIFHTGLY